MDDKTKERITEGLENRLDKYFVKRAVEDSGFAISGVPVGGICIESNVKVVGLSIDEAARIFGMSYCGVYKWVQFGKVDSWKFNGKVWLDIGSVYNYCKAGQQNLLVYAVNEVYGILYKKLHSVDGEGYMMPCSDFVRELKSGYLE